jgi:hypothetical protein
VYLVLRIPNNCKKNNHHLHILHNLCGGYNDPGITVIFDKMADVVQALNKVRAQLQARGAKTIRGLGRTFRQLDSFDGNKKVDC